MKEYRILEFESYFTVQTRKIYIRVHRIIAKLFGEPGSNWRSVVEYKGEGMRFGVKEFKSLEEARAWIEKDKKPPEFPKYHYVE